jgi:hypothetical protein
MPAIESASGWPVRLKMRNSFIVDHPRNRRVSILLMI